MKNDKAFIAEVKVSKIYSNGISVNIVGLEYTPDQRLHGYATSSVGQCYIPSRFIRGLRVGDTFTAELLPTQSTGASSTGGCSKYPPTKYTVWSIQRTQDHGMKIYNRSNVVERTPGVRSQSC